MSVVSRSSCGKWASVVIGSNISHSYHIRNYGMVWCGVVWCDMVWCGVVWYGIVWGVVWYGTLFYLG